MFTERSEVQAFSQLLNEYFPNDTVQVLEDVRAAERQPSRVEPTEPSLLISLTSTLPY
jgi:hypothetical protein